VLFELKTKADSGNQVNAKLDPTPSICRRGEPLEVSIPELCASCRALVVLFALVVLLEELHDVV
jgi:hypothetical protein